MSCQWNEAIEQLESVNRALRQAGNEKVAQLVGERRRAVERIAALAALPAGLTEELLLRLSRALGEGAQLRQRLALQREQSRVGLDDLNRAAVLLRRLNEEAAGPISKFDCRG